MPSKILNIPGEGLNDLLSNAVNLGQRLGLGDIPFFDRETKLLNNILQEHQVALLRLQHEVEAADEEAASYETHIISVKEATHRNTDILMAKRHEVEQEKALLKTAEILRGRYRRDIKLCSETVERIQANIERLETKMKDYNEAIRHAMPR
ncbi:uncharacterized protein LOC111700299 [Eurytemora carolleeae]|uniref:uncharacterized protein LOC111700299 n=1 Tax=Eurytemora carolleeae TaxID=1294199 RepID=UPI000C768D89|nr:uncharacterized protein LOC111700299 [Eurytemora carolleeae]|eukprot:XP_023326938.1 uncharacterized protein LOC111700299 [Eurytemora affinis]